MQKTIDLLKPIEGHTGPIKQVKVREPNYREYLELGDPVIMARNPDGTIFPVENQEVIKQYIERIVVEPDHLLLSQLGLADTMKVKDALLDFFSQARVATSTNTSTSSSST